jgi:hypothetical protein
MPWRIPPRSPTRIRWIGIAATLTTKLYLNTGALEKPIHLITAPSALQLRLVHLSVVPSNVSYRHLQHIRVHLIRPSVAFRPVVN